MDAANPLCRCLLVAGLVAIAGCHGTSAVMNARGQAPPELPGPLAPLRPATPLTPPPPTTPTDPVAPGSPVQGLPVTGGPVDPAVAPSGYSTLPNVIRATELIKDGIPQIKVVALVGTTNLITDQEITEAVRQRLPDLAGLTTHARVAKEKELYASEMRKIIERELILDDMYTRLKKNNKASSIEDIKEYATKSAEQSLRAIRKERGIKTESEFEAFLRLQGLSIPVIRRQIERQMMADEYVRSVLKEKGRTPGFADVRTYFDLHPEEFKTEDRVKWLDVFINFNKHPNPRAAYDHAEMVRQQAADPGADFAAISKKYDNGLASGTNGVGIGSTRGQIQPADVEATVWALQPGQTSGLIETPVGYHVVKVVEREFAGVRTFDAKVQTEIRNKLRGQYRELEYKKMIEDLWRKGTVKLIEMP